MSSPSNPGDPRIGRDRRVPAKARTFKHGTVDPVTNHRRPLLTIGNLILLVIMVGFGMYATGNLPQLDTFFDHVNNYGREHNNLVVNTMITYGAYLFGALVLALVVWMIFLFINANRRSHSDPKGWHKVASAPPERRKSERRSAVKRPSVIRPHGKQRPANNVVDPKPEPVPATAKAEAPTSAPVNPMQPDAAKAAAIAAAVKAEAAIAKAPADPPSFILPLGKTAVPKAELPATSTTPAATPIVAVKSDPPTAIPETPPAPTAPTTDTPALAATAANAKAEAVIAAAKAAAAKAEATMAAAKAEAAIAAAKAEVAAAEAAIAAAKAETIAS